MSLNNALLFAGVLAEVAVIGLLLYRRVWRTLPVFCVYVVWGLLGDAMNYAVQRSPAGIDSKSYFISYAVGSALDSALQIAVLIELAWSILRPLWPSLSRRALVVVGLLIVAVAAAIWPFAGIHGLEIYPPAWRNLVHLEQTAAILRILFFMGLAGTSQLLSIGWRDREMQVATGLGFYSLVSLSVVVWRSHQGMEPQYALLSQILIVSYFCSLLYWVFSFAQQEAERREFTPQMQNFLLAVAGTARTTRMTLTDSSGDKTGGRGR